MVVGFPEAVSEVVAVLRDVLKRSYFSKRLPLNAVFRGVVEKKVSQDLCHVRTPLETRGVLRDPLCFQGQTTDFTITGYENDLETPVLRRGVSVVGRFMILNDSGSVQYSEHIRDPDIIEELRGLSEIIIKEGYGVKWRSSAKYADTVSLIEEYGVLKKRLEEVRSSLEKRGPGEFVYIGEEIVFIHLSPDDMTELDVYRASVVDTAPMHHILKTYTSMGDLVDLIDRLARLEKREFIDAMCRLFREGLQEHEVYILHRRLFFSRPIIIGPARPLYISSYREGDRSEMRIVLTRTVRGEGVYDGLEVSREPGDRILSLVDTSTSYIVHGYYNREGVLKGVYINMNTRPYIVPDIDTRHMKLRVKIVYNDLYIDGVLQEGVKKIVDESEFTNICGRGLLPDVVCRDTRETLSRVLERGDEILGIFREDLRPLVVGEVLPEERVIEVFDRVMRLKRSS